jgi:hypothetical protein
MPQHTSRPVHALLGMVLETQTLLAVHLSNNGGVRLPMKLIDSNNTIVDLMIEYFY